MIFTLRKKQNAKYYGNNFNINFPPDDLADTEMTTLGLGEKLPHD